MIAPVLLFAAAAVLTLLLGFETWRLTSSKGVRLNTFLGAAALGYAAYGLTRPGGAAPAAVLAFFVAMLFGGRALGFSFRSRKDGDLKRPARLLFTVAGSALVAASAALYWG